ncbi:hypothetical protein VP01_3484g1 [Puccinia sorghi]|uniref:Uncharacterized protein n=1 Tax=Puccinia sorghi TaxID=27349 RepID=A0A0L6UW02_9BASI|nr:hypothetical protein VP01_3484g1 [Puccinia sorghi]
MANFSAVLVGTFAESTAPIPEDGLRASTEPIGDYPPSAGEMFIAHRHYLWWEIFKRGDLHLNKDVMMLIGFPYTLMQHSDCPPLMELHALRWNNPEGFRLFLGHVGGSHHHGWWELGSTTWIGGFQIMFKGRKIIVMWTTHDPHIISGEWPGYLGILTRQWVGDCTGLLICSMLQRSFHSNSTFLLMQNFWHSHWAVCIVTVHQSLLSKFFFAVVVELTRLTSFLRELLAANSNPYHILVMRIFGKKNSLQKKLRTPTRSITPETHSLNTNQYQRQLTGRICLLELDCASLNTLRVQVSLKLMATEANVRFHIWLPSCPCVSFMLRQHRVIAPTETAKCEFDTLATSLTEPTPSQTKMLKWLPWLFIVLVAIIFVASANEEILYGGQQLVEASNEAASATTTGHAVFPPVERESRTANNALNKEKDVSLQTDESDDDLLTIGLGTRGAYPLYPSSFGQSSRSGVISVFSEKPIHLANNRELLKFKSDDHRLFLSGVSLEHVTSQASSSTRRIDLSDFDETRKTDASASAEHCIPSPTNPPGGHSEPSIVGRKTLLQSDAPITRETWGNSATHEQEDARGTKRKISNSWGPFLSLKTGVTLHENETQDSYVTQDFLSGLLSKQPIRLSSEENNIATPQFIPQEIQQNAGGFNSPVLSAGGRIPWQMSSMALQNCRNVFISLKPPDQRENEKSWGADQGTSSSPPSKPQKSLRAEKDILEIKAHHLKTQNTFLKPPRCPKLTS